MNRKLFCQWFETPQGRVLLQNEAYYLKKAITLGCKQTILQLGSLGWEDQFIDCSLFRAFIVLDAVQLGCQGSVKILANVGELPVASDSADMVILPHVLEFNQNYLQVLREAERVLKPEGKLIVLGFNPWSRFSLYQSIVRDQKKAPCRGNFISRLRLIDRLSMLNFEAEVAAGFNIKTVASNSSDYEKSKRALTVTAYAVKAVKRRFNIIPLRPAVEEKPRLAVAGAVESSGWLKHG